MSCSVRGTHCLTVLVALPFWLSIAPRYEKSTLFIVGALLWTASFSLILLAQPDWPRWALLAFAPMAAIGFAVVDLMPWSMLGEVVDEDDLISGERREGLYNGFFMFLRKLGGTVAVLLLGLVLGAMGLDRGDQQSEETLLTIRLLASVAPAAFLIVAIFIARGYPLTRVAHAEILARLEKRNRES